jgi:cell wall assembly regulator SMI1
VCFYWAKGRKLSDDSELNGSVTARVAKALVGRGWMIDYAPGPQGKFFRIVVGRETRKETVEALVKAISDIASKSSTNN